MSKFATHYFTSESVTEGHPDKMCDQISDAVLDAHLEQDPSSRVAVETATKTGLVILLGEITSNAVVNIDEVVRNTIKEIGYDDSKKSFDYKTCSVLSSISKQSADIALGVDSATDSKIKEIGAGDQGMMFGYACDETPTLIPLPIYLAHKLTRKLAEVRKTNKLPFIYPDGKSQVTVEYEDGKPIRVDTVLVSTQHSEDVGVEEIREQVNKEVIEPSILGLMDSRTKIFINPTGRFVIGGPKGDAGCTGRKIIVDTYGGMGRHGGGAFSGKDPTKVDRSGAYMARWIAKSIVASKLARKCEIQVSYAIGMSEPLSIFVDTFGTGSISNEEIIEVIQKNFDLRPGAIIEQLDLRRPIFRDTAKYGHFGREDREFSWEKVKKLS